MNYQQILAIFAVSLVTIPNLATAGGLHCCTPGYKQKVKIKGYAPVMGVGGVREFYSPTEFFAGGVTTVGGFEFFPSFATREFVLARARETDRGDLREAVQAGVSRALESKTADSSPVGTPQVSDASELSKKVSDLNKKIDNVEEIVKSIQADTTAIKQDLAFVKQKVIDQDKILQAVGARLVKEEEEKQEARARKYHELQMRFFETLAGDDKEAKTKALQELKNFPTTP